MIVNWKITISTSGASWILSSLTPSFIFFILWAFLTCWMKWFCPSLVVIFLFLRLYEFYLKTSYIKMSLVYTKKISSVKPQNYLFTVILKHSTFIKIKIDITTLGDVVGLPLAHNPSVVLSYLHSPFAYLISLIYHSLVSYQDSKCQD